MSATHNPYGPATIDPAEWTALGDFYRGSSEEIAAEYDYFHGELGIALGLGEDWDWDQLHEIVEFNGTNGHGCAMCGSYFAYGVVFTNGETNIAIGHICAREYLSLPDRSTLIRKRAASAAATTRKRKIAAAKAATYLGENPEVAEAFETDHYIVQDIRGKLFQYGSISERQEALVLKIAREEAERAVLRAEAAEKLANAPVLPEGRYEIEGVVISTKSKPGFAYNQTVYKMLVELADGNRVWGTIPRAIEDDVWGTSRTVTVKFTAAVQRSDDDEHFGFFSRPTKPEVVARKEVA